MAPKAAAKAGAKARAKATGKATPKKKGTKAKTAPWNKGRHQSVTDSQNIFLQKEDLPLFWAVVLFCCGPIYLAVIWVCLISQRRISECLRLRGQDIHLEGGPDCDQPYIRFAVRESERHLPGMGKLRGKTIISRLPSTAQDTIKQFLETGLEHECWPALERMWTAHTEVLAKIKATAPRKFQPQPLHEDALWFATPRPSSKCPWLSRQSVWTAVDKARGVMYKLTRKRRFNPAKAFRGSHITVHGATRHTAAALLLCPADDGSQGPSQATILALQGRTDVRTFERHYLHPQEQDLIAAVEHNAIPLQVKSNHTERMDSESQGGISMAPEPEAPGPVVPVVPEAGAKSNHMERMDEESQGGISMAPEPEAPGPVVPEAGARAKCSRNAWRQQKRRQGKRKWQQGSGSGQ